MFHHIKLFQNRDYTFSAIYKVLNYGVKKEFIDRYDVEEQLKKNRLTVPQIVEDICRIW